MNVDMKPFYNLFVALILFAPIVCSVGCGSNEPINVMEGQSREDLDAQAEAMYSGEEEFVTPPPTDEERAMNAG